MKGYNIALTFSAQQAEAIAMYSQALAPDISSDYIIGANSYPHLTLLHIECDPDRLIPLVQEAARQWCPLLVTATQTYRHQGSGGLYWYGLTITPTAELSALQQELWERLDCPATHNKIGEAFFPHITTGHGTLREDILLPDATSVCVPYWCHLAMGQSGPRYQLETLMFQV